MCSSPCVCRGSARGKRRALALLLHHSRGPAELAALRPRPCPPPRAQGWIPLTVVAAFNRVRMLTPDPSVVVAAMQVRGTAACAPARGADCLPLCSQHVCLAAALTAAPAPACTSSILPTPSAPPCLPQHSSIVEVSRDNLFMRPRDGWQQWVLPEEQRDKAFHPLPQQSPPTAGQQQQPGAKAKGSSSGGSGELPADAPLQQPEAEPAQPDAAAGQAEGPAPAPQEPPQAAEPAAPAQPVPAAAPPAAAPPAAEPAATSSPPPALPSHDVKAIAEDEELNEDDMFQLDEVRLPAAPPLPPLPASCCLPPPCPRHWAASRGGWAKQHDHHERAASGVGCSAQPLCPRPPAAAQEHQVTEAEAAAAPPPKGGKGKESLSNDDLARLIVVKPVG